MPIPLSLSQEELSSVGPVTMTVAFELADGIDTGRLGDALDLVISRHEPLRMRLLKCPDGSMQQEFRDTGLTDRPGVQVVKSLDTALAVFRTQLPDITRDSPIRTAFFRDADENKTVVAFHIDHMAIDGWGLGLFTSELSQAYHALGAGAALTLPDLPMSFTEYVEMERKAGETVTAAQINYWTDLLVNGSPYELPSDLVRTGAKERVEASIGSTVPPGATAALLELSRKLRVPMPALVIASIGIAAMARSRVSDVLLKNIYLGRDVPGSMKMIGLFTRTSFLRLQLDAGLSVEELIKNTSRSLLAGITYSSAPFTIGRMFKHLLESGAADRETLARLGRSVTVNYFGFDKGVPGGNQVLGRRIPVPRQSAYSVGNDVMPLLVEVRVGDEVAVGSTCNPERYRMDGVINFLDSICTVLSAFTVSDLSVPVCSMADAIVFTTEG
jgi:hypothetical protein